MKALKITKGFNQLLHMLKANNMDTYMTLSEVVVQIIAGKNFELLQEALELSKTIKENKNATTVWINNETYDTLKIVQSRYKERYNKTIPVGDIAEGLCTKSLKSICYRELLNAHISTVNTQEINYATIYNVKEMYQYLHTTICW